MIYPLSLWRSALMTALLYGVAAAGAVVLTRFDGGVAFVWFASAVLLARLSLLPTKTWPPFLASCFIPAVLVGGLFGVGWRAAPFLALINVGEAVFAALILQRLLKRASYFDSVDASAAFLLVAGGVAPLASGLLGAGVVTLATSLAYGGNLAHWIAAHALGAVTCTPLVTLVMRGEIGAWLGTVSRRRRIEALGWAVTLGVIVLIVFSQRTLPILFLPMLPMMAATIRCGRLGAAASIVILTLFGGVLSLRGFGPVHLMSAGDGLKAEFFQLYVACAAALVLPVAAMLKQRDALVVQLSESEAKYRLIAERSSDAILNVDADGTIRYASPSLKELTGHDPIAVIGRNAREFVVAEDIVQVSAIHRQALRDPAASLSVEYRAPLAEGGTGWFEMRTRGIVAEDGQVVGVVNAIREVGERKRQEEALTVAANTDPLTGLANRRAFMSTLEKRVGQVRDGDCEGSLAVFDLDFFKSVNDRHGHATGDLVLQAFAATARRTLRGMDCIGRIGGEEFAVILWNVGPEEARFVCERLRRAVRETPVRIDGGATISITVSAGVTPIRPPHGPPDLLDLADRALYAAKAAGRDRVSVASRPSEEAASLAS